jgi:hypothetical protein
MVENCAFEGDSDGTWYTFFVGCNAARYEAVTVVVSIAAIQN